MWDNSTSPKRCLWKASSFIWKAPSFFCKASFCDRSNLKINQYFPKTKGRLTVKFFQRWLLSTRKSCKSRCVTQVGLLYVCAQCIEVNCTENPYWILREIFLVPSRNRWFEKLVIPVASASSIQQDSGVHEEGAARSIFHIFWQACRCKSTGLSQRC